MLCLLLLNAADVKKKEAKEKQMHLEEKIADCPEYKFKSKIENIFVNKKILEEYSVKIY